MSNKSNKLYKKALKYYYKGDIENAISFSTKSINESFKNSAALNLKGLLYYLKGDLEESRRIWMLNFKGNNDGVSKKYLDDCREEKSYYDIYLEALALVRDLQISEAIVLLEKCKDTHFNCINVDTNLALCYIKKGEYDKALKCINEVLKIDGKNKMALECKKNLIDFNIIKREINYKKIIRFSTISLLLVCFIYVGNKVYPYVKRNFSDLYTSGLGKKQDLNEDKDKKDNKHKDILSDKKKLNQSEKNKKTGNNISKDGNNKGENKQIDLSNNKENGAYSEKGKTLDNNSSSEAKNKDKKVTNDKEVFPAKSIKEYIQKEDVLSLHKELKQWQGKKLDNNNKLLLKEAKNFMDNSAGIYFYYTGKKYFSQKNYVESINNYGNGILYGVGKFPYEDSLYMVALSYERSGDNKNAIKFYERYYKEFNEKGNIQEGNYIKEVLRSLVNLYKNIDQNKCKFYSEQL